MLDLFDEAGIAPEMREAVRGTIEKRLSAIEGPVGPLRPGPAQESILDR